MTPQRKSNPWVSSTPSQKSFCGAFFKKRPRPLLAFLFESPKVTRFSLRLLLAKKKRLTAKTKYPSTRHPELVELSVRRGTSRAESEER